MREANNIVGDAVFRRDVHDQEYLDTLDYRIKRLTDTRGWRAVLDRDAVVSLSPVLGAITGLTLLTMLYLLGGPISAAGAVATILVCAAIAIFLRGPWGRRVVFECWALFDYGRSWRRVAIFGFLSIVVFGALFALLEPTHLVLSRTELAQGNLANLNRSQPFLLAAIGFASGGLLGVAEIRTSLGLLVIMLNALFGYATLGLFLAVLGNTFARQGH